MSDSEAIREEKRRIRAWAREIRAAISPEAYEQASREIEARVLGLPAYREAGTVMAYMSMPGEPDTRGIIRDAVRRGKTVLLPACIDRERMTARRFAGFGHLINGRMNIPEPEAEDGDPVPEPEVILVPCVAADREGKRLGHGAGYYDRFLQGKSGRKIGLCFSALMRETVPTGEDDVELDEVVTDGGRREESVAR